ncbi:Beta-galactosidase [Kribbella flavida DSM 17836]|uniref:Beta-galactosidase n=1 Tax=Kribbella flavida (strain DSM 17836 / JCM 10339 / NBRC 14399) TaxID=479435 RepID=D2PPG3_KRIFD|nr:beta-galactosidase [Kribbella flavida]ADB30925.1 Beta-galactosidase [Kribbella flavida DSM 17836]
MTGLYFGGDYNPEQWPPEVWKHDVALMRRAGANLVTVGVFAWSSLEPEPGRYEFGWLDQVMDLLAEGGVQVDLATPTASPPPWFSLRHPEALPVNADGTRLTHGSRDTYCACAPAYREAAAGIARALGERYAGHPALAMWHVHNEYGTTCYCDHAAEAFRRWLRDRYGDLDRLNGAWTTAFWSQGYASWEEVRPPRATQYLVNPTHALDFRRFWSDELLAAYQEQQQILRAFTPDLPITTNFVFGAWVPVDHARWAAEVDLVAIDHYPGDPGIGAEQQTALGADLARSWAGGRSWLLMEQAAGSVNDGQRLHTKEPGRMTRHSLAHVARGSKGALFFQWRASRGGAEMWHSALVPHAGAETRRFREVAELGALLPRLAELEQSAVQADVAVLWDVESWWAMQATHLPSSELDYLAAVQAAHRQLWATGVGVDLPGPAADLSAYRLVVVPSLYLVSAEAAASIARYVEGGGHVLVTYFSGIVNDDAQVWLGGYPGAFADLLGIRVEEFHPAAEVELASGARGRIWSEDVQLAGAEVIDRYAGGVLDGSPAVTRNVYGEGVAWYVSTQLEDDAYRAVLEQAMRGAGIELPELPAGVELVRRRADGTTWSFLINHGDEEAVVPVDGVDLVSGAEVRGSVTLPAGGQAVVRSV